MRCLLAALLLACAVASALAQTATPSDSAFNNRVSRQIDAAVLAAGTAPTTAEDRDATLAKQAFSARLRQPADRALKRYDKPAGIAPDWRSEAEFAVKGSR